MARYADIILPLALFPLTFEIDESLEVELGSAVVVPMGYNRELYYTGIVWAIHSNRPPFEHIKRVVRTLYPRPLLNSVQRAFWEWISQYYMCSLGEVMRVALPSMMKPSADTIEEFEMELYPPRKEYYITLHQSIDQLEQLIPRRAHRQLSALESLRAAQRSYPAGRIPRRLVECEMAILRGWESRELISLEMGEVTLESPEQRHFSLPTLSPDQQAALQQIESSFATKSTTLLHGVTGSGKTEIYIHLIAKELEQGNDVLLLLPEIALTSQLLERMERIFGSRVVAYHSKLSPRKRTEIYLQIAMRDGGNFILGVRSAIFLPLKKLSLTIVDEEHDSSYKQSDVAPRYNARDAASLMASTSSGKTLLGSATPSLESYTNALSGKYGMATLDKRYGDATTPEVIISDTQRAVKRGERKGHFNHLLLEKISQRLERKEQVILFQNRRGFAPYIECTTCGWTPRCPHCNVTLTLHKGQSRLTCHYCSYTIPAVEECPKCHTTPLKSMGFGTEKIEWQVAELFPEARIERLDRDSVTSSTALKAIISRFERGETDILIGTQMITKGFDFSKVTLVGILNADNLLNNPDFRAEERAFQLITQVAGRAGRRAEAGEVVIQTAQSDHRILSLAITKDYERFAATLLEERNLFSYPPYSRIIAITIYHKDRDRLYSAANYLTSLLRPIFGRRLQGPLTPVVDKIRDEHIVEFSLKIESSASSKRAKILLAEQIEILKKSAPFKSINVVCDVDPQ